MKFAKRMDRFGEGVFSRLEEMKRKKLEAGAEVHLDFPGKAMCEWHSCRMSRS